MLRIAQTGQCDRDNSPGLLRRVLVQRLHQGKSIPPRHCDVTYQDVRDLAPDCRQGLLRRLRGSSIRTEPVQKLRERLARVAMIFNDENPGALKRPRRRGRRLRAMLLLGPGLQGLQWQRHREGGTLVHPFTMALMRPPCSSTSLRAIASPRPKSVVLSGGAAVRLPEHVKHEGQEFGADTFAGVADGQSDFTRATFEDDTDTAALPE